MMLSSNRRSFLKDRYRGCLIGALIGDCLGSIFEGKYILPIDRKTVEKKIGVKSIIKKNGKRTYEYTDDSAMTFSVAKSLIDNKGHNALDLITKFLEKFKNEQDRGYGAGMFTIFEKWQKQGSYTEDVYLASREQFDGKGSYGNGSAMRISPVSLFCDSMDNVIQLAKKNSLLTHSHYNGYNGGILQALAVYKLIETDADGIDTTKFVNDLINAMKDVELENNCISDDESSNHLKWSRISSFTFTNQLNVILKLISTKDETYDEFNSIVESLGNDVSAQEAVPAALYSFLRHANKGSFTDVILYAVSLGGDTDTIASMAGALAGMYMGYSAIPKPWIDVCEDSDVMMKYADELFDLRFGK